MNTDLTEFKEFDLQRKPEVESYTFRGKDFQWWFNITITEGRIYLSGDAGDNVFIVRGTNEELKKWLLDLDMDYALGKSYQGREYFDGERAEKYIKARLLDEAAHTEEEAQAIIEQLDFSSHVLLQNSMCSTEKLYKIFPDYWELNLLGWSPMQKMQYKQLLFAGAWFKAQREKANAKTDA